MHPKSVRIRDIPDTDDVLVRTQFRLCISTEHEEHGICRPERHKWDRAVHRARLQEMHQGLVERKQGQAPMAREGRTVQSLTCAETGAMLCGIGVLQH